MSITTPISLSIEQKDFFVQNGYLRLPQAMTPDLLETLRASVDRLCKKADQLSHAAIITGTDHLPHVIGIEHLGALPESIFAELLGSPMLLSLAQDICGPDFFPVQDFLVIKSKNDGNEVKWHQDILTEPLSKTIMVGFYLDDANRENGALRIIPASHTSKLPICELEKKEYSVVDMKAGDVLIHDLMLAHSSGPLTTYHQRRVVYFEFMSAAQALSEDIYQESYIDRRTELISTCIQYFSEAHPKTSPFEWRNPKKEEQLSDKEPFERIQEIYSIPRKAHVANYCFDQIGR